ncbi:phosphotransferase family protein [Auraticoccus monumenti]|uniref:Predicted kinase, aminoglycoside phosphotransferase (APT) family n=1 Tax=Auraticoccus monumenti TaxID=675864 RepID=A0A1G7BMW6_9ACTN|nr:aminoglycoside phosphotransferase family protein [Auraticoccus monumenti]SDE28010.1 Predicted kinase, aminoglycoside phosphotransferase (APT) family [Auraticoccus monumenti]
MTAPTSPGEDPDGWARALAEHLAHVGTPDGWRPAVQGAVATVLGVVAPDGTPLVAKVFPAAAARRGRTEARALELLADLPDVPVPRLVHSGPLPGAGSTVVVMTRLPGVRWADHTLVAPATDRLSLARQAGQLLRSLHVLTAEGFGGPLPDDPVQATLLARVEHTAAEQLEAFTASGGTDVLAARVRRLVRAHRDVLRRPVRPALCHHDLNGGNVLVGVSGPARITGLVDLERVGWDDPMADLALTTTHLRQHETAAAEALLEAYDPTTEERRRLELHVVLLTVAERAWVATDRPQGWEASVARLEQLLRDAT